MLVLDADFPDPFILPVAGGYFAYATQSGPRNVQVAWSTDLRSWECLGDALPRVPAWSRPGFTWSPSVLATAQGFVMYVAVRPRNRERQVIALAVSPSPEGPFTPVDGPPLVNAFHRGGAIDPDPFLDSTGQVHLLYKTDGELIGRPATLWSRPLRPDGLQLSHRGARLLRRELAWEQPLIEAPCLWDNDGHLLLFYSAGTWTDAGYGIGYAVGRSPRGPFTRPGDGAWFLHRPGIAGPGGQCVVRAHSGASYLAYHAWSPARVGYAAGGARRLHIDLLESDEGQPRLRSDW